VSAIIDLIVTTLALSGGKGAKLRQFFRLSGFPASLPYLLEDVQPFVIAHHNPATDFIARTKTAAAVSVVQIHAANAGTGGGEVRGVLYFWIFTTHFSLS
jgi:hypothetical protein